MADTKRRNAIAERQRSFRARQRDAGLAEIRGIYAPPALHSRLKQAVARLLRRVLPPV